jgi:hypothetical protein
MHIDRELMIESRGLMDRNKAKKEQPTKNARCSLRLQEDDLQWLRRESQRRKWSMNRFVESLIRAAKERTK